MYSCGFLHVCADGRLAVWTVYRYTSPRKQSTPPPHTTKVIRHHIKNIWGSQVNNERRRSLIFSSPLVKENQKLKWWEKNSCLIDGKSRPPLFPIRHTNLGLHARPRVQFKLKLSPPLPPPQQRYSGEEWGELVTNWPRVLSSSAHYSHYFTQHLQGYSFFSLSSQHYYLSCILSPIVCF